MKKTLAVIALLAFASIAAAAGGTWTGVVTDTTCGEKDAKADGAKCSTKCVKEHGAHWALWDPKAKQLYELVNAKDAEAMAGKAVTVKGTLEKGDKKIDVASMEAAPAAK
jgi:predicted small secreted protein